MATEGCQVTPPTMITIDPGKCYVGVAKFEGQTLIHAATVKSKQKWPQGAVEVAEKLRPLGPVDELWFEFPVVYPKQTRAPNDLLPLCYADGLLTAVLSPRAIHAVEPATWKGTIDADIVINRVKAALTPAEHATVKSKDHNCFDAIGIGLWRLKRINTGR